MTDETCGHTRDLLPQLPGAVVLVCDRKPHKSGKHSRHDENGRVTEQWWGDKQAQS